MQDRDDRSRIGESLLVCSCAVDEKWGMDMRLMMRLNRILLCAGMILAMLPLVG